MLSTAQTARKIVKSSSTKPPKKQIVKGEAKQVNELLLDDNYELKELGVETGISTLTPTVRIDSRAHILDITAVIIADENYVETSSRTLKANSYKIEVDKLIPFVAYEKPADVKRVTGETITALKKSPQLLLANATDFAHVMKVYTISSSLKSEFHFGFKRKQNSSNAKTESEEENDKKKSVSCTHVQLFFSYLVNLGTFDALGNPLFAPKFCRITFKYHSAADKVYTPLPAGTTIDMQFPTILAATNNSWSQFKNENGFVADSTVAAPDMSIQNCAVPYENAIELCLLKAQEVEQFLHTVQSTQISALKGNKTPKNHLKRKASSEEDDEEGFAPKAKVNRTETATSASFSIPQEQPQVMQEEVTPFNFNFLTNMQQLHESTLQEQINSECQAVTNLDLLNAWLMNNSLIPIFSAGQQFDNSYKPQSLLPEGQQVIDFSAFLGQQVQQPQEQQQEAEQNVAQPLSFCAMMNM